MNHADGLPAELQRPIKPPYPVVDDNIAFRTVISINFFPVLSSYQFCYLNCDQRFQGKLSVHRPYRIGILDALHHRMSPSIVPHLKISPNALVRRKKKLKPSRAYLFKLVNICFRNRYERRVGIV